MINAPTNSRPSNKSIAFIPFIVVYTLLSEERDQLYFEV